MFSKLNQIIDENIELEEIFNKINNDVAISKEEDELLRRKIVSIEPADFIYPECFKRIIILYNKIDISNEVMKVFEKRPTIRK